METIRGIVEIGIASFIAVYLTKINSEILKKMIQNTEEMKELVNRICYAVGKTVLKKEQAIMLFRSVMSEHMEKKICYIRELLHNNHLESRKVKIQENISTVFKEITQTEAEKMRGFNCESGNLAEIFESNIDWESFLKETYDIVFSKDTIETKISDLKTLMLKYITHIEQQI